MLLRLLGRLLALPIQCEQVRVEFLLVVVVMDVERLEAWPAGRLYDLAVHMMVMEAGHANWLYNSRMV